MNKKQMILVALMICAAISLSHAQTYYPVLKTFSATQKERMDKSFAISLSSMNNGLVASALTVVTMMKLDLPSDEFPMIMDKIDYLAAHGKTPLIRYRASLAEAVFAHASMFKEKASRQYSDPDALFSALDHNSDTQPLSSK